MKLIDCEQGTPEWHQARCGKVTASRVCDIVRQTKNGVSKMRQTYLGELVAERLSGIQEDGFTSKPMEWGKDKEDEARKVYAFIHGRKVTRVGFVDHERIAMAGASPDSLVDDDGMLEVKCPNTSTHIATLLGERIDPDYVKQMQWGMACTGRRWCDFVSFDPRMPAEMQLYVQRVERDQLVVADLEAAVIAFIGEVDATVGKLRSLYGTAEAA